jgi:hypothetical protein
MLFIYSLEEPPEYAVIDLENGVDLAASGPSSGRSGAM